MKKVLISALAFAMPLMALAEEGTDLSYILITVRDLVNTIVPLFMVIAVAVFLWGIVQYITASGDEEKSKTARGYIIYGLIGVFVMVAFWGIINVVATTFGITTGGTIEAPTFEP